jgi:hypothetical protein
MKVTMYQKTEQDIDIHSLGASLADDPAGFALLLKEIVRPTKTKDNPLGMVRFEPRAVAGEMVGAHAEVDWEPFFAIIDSVRHLKRTGA